MQKEEQVSFLAEKIRQADAVLIGGGSSLPSGERNILTLIATKLICATAPAHKYEGCQSSGWRITYTVIWKKEIITKYWKSKKQHR